MNKENKNSQNTPSDPEPRKVEGWSDWKIWTVVIAIIIATAGLIVYQRYYHMFSANDEVLTESDQSEDLAQVSSIFDWQKSASVWGGLSSHASVVFQDKLWVFGGKNKDGIVTNEVWSSSDGANWSKVSSNNAWQVRSSHKAVVYNNKIWIMGGISEAREQLNDVWSSDDGVNWIRVTNSATWPVRADFELVIFNNKLLVLGGWSSTSPQGGDTTYYNDAWSSADGSTWEQLSSDSAWSKRSNFSAYTYNNKIFVAGGLTSIPRKEFSDIYSSGDGKTWTKVGDLPDARGAGDIVTANGSFYFIDGYDNEQALSYSFYRKDGISWSRADNAEVGPSRTFHTAEYFKDKIWLIGGTDFTSDRVNDLWSTEIIGDK